ncbi:MAG TPA: S9 family peptidase [Thermoanaerobaculia bacterium]|nr:S9 family peptidase [Thermoanaerobaculia bacterium]
MRRLTFLAAGALLFGALPARAQRPFRFDDLQKLERLTSYSVSPDGRSIAYAVTTSRPEENRSLSAIWLQPAAGGAPRRLTAGDFKDTDPAFSPDGRTLAFLSNRGGSQQIWTLDLAGGEPRAAAAFVNDVSAFHWSPDGKWFVFSSDVFPECADPACTQKRLKERAATKIKARIAERLLFRHWDTWKDGMRQHIWRVAAGGGDFTDLTPGDRDAPAYGQDKDFSVSPDGKELLFTANPDRVEAVSTNSDVWVANVDGSGGARNLTAANPAYDGNPRFSPDGRMILYRAQKRPAHESDRFELMVLDRGTGRSRSLTADFDNWVEDAEWTPDSKAIVFTALVEGRQNLYRVPAAGGPIALLWKGGAATMPEISADGRRVYFSATSMTDPVDVWAVGADGKGAARVTHLNAALLAEAARGPVSERFVKSADGRSLQAWLFQPPGFDPSKTYPAIFFVHGGPQVPVTDAWSYRWNLALFASYGYVVYAPNPRGSPGWGQKFVDEISGDWGGKVYDDLMRQADDLEALPYVDKKKIGAAGASYGGYMIAWIAGHTTRFATLVCHDGTVDLAPANLATEELWFPKVEFGGWPWESGADYNTWNPIRFADKFQTPTLVIHNEKDYRVPFDQGLEFFTALQLKGVPSKFVTFPDEGHWVLKPGNALFWHNVIIDWLHQYLGGAPADPKELAKAYSVTR